MKIQSRILWHFQRLIKVVSTLNHKVETTLNRRWNVGWETWLSNDRWKIRLYVLAWNFWKSDLTSVKHLSLSIYQVSSPTLYHSARRLIADSLCQKCPNTEIFLVRVFLDSVWIHENTDKKKLHIWTLFTQSFELDTCWEVIKFFYAKVSSKLTIKMTDIRYFIRRLKNFKYHRNQKQYCVILKEGKSVRFS